MSERRKERRVPIEAPIVLKIGKRAVVATTRDVSYRGLYVSLNELPGLRQLVQIEFELPGEARPFTAHAMVIRHGESPSGIGLEFFGSTSHPEWDGYVQNIMRQPPAAMPRVSVAPPAPAQRISVPPPLPNARPSYSPPGPYQGPERRRAPRIVMRLELRLRTPRSIHAAHTTDISMAGVCVVSTDVQAGIGEQVIVNLIQPGTSFSFRRDGVLQRLVPKDGGWQHVAIEFSPLDGMKEVLFAEFMNRAWAASGGG
jgi:hypothetical protein